MKLMRTLRNTAAVAIGLITGLQSGISAYALPLNTKYISDIRSYMADSPEEARAKFEAEGYTMMDTNVNERLTSENGNAKAVYLGYKTSYDINDAIRGMHFMNMLGKYSFNSYETALAEHRVIVDNNLDGIVPAIEEYRTAYAAKTENALHAYEMLNHVYDYVSGQSMGDFLLECELAKGKRDALTDAFMKGNSAIVTQIQRLLLMAGFSAKNSWLERFEATSLEELTKLYESSYYSSSRAQKAMAQDYFTEAAAILSNHWDAVYESLQFVEENMTMESEDSFRADHLYDKVLENYGEPNTDEEYAEAASAIVSTSISAQNAAAVYAALSLYEYNGSPMLDFFNRPKSEVRVEELYPLVASFSEADRGLSQSVPLGEMIIQASGDDHWDAASEDRFKFWEDQSGTVSLYYGVNLKAFEKGVALTSAATQRDQTDGFWKSWFEVFQDPNTSEGGGSRFARPGGFLMLTACSGVAMLVSALISKWIAKLVGVNSSAAAAGVVESSENVVKLIVNKPQMGDTNEMFGRNCFTFVKRNIGIGYGWLYTIFQVFFLVFYLVMVICLVLTVVTAIMSFWHTQTYTQIPIAMCDAWQGGSFAEYIIYDAVAGLDPVNMQFGDMNGYTENYGDIAGLISDASVGWNVLYVTKDVNAGDPITELKFTKGSSTVPLGYEGVTLFGEGSTANISSTLFTGQDSDNDPEIRLYVKRKPVSAAGSVFTNSKVAVAGTLALLGGSAIGALLGLRRRKKQDGEPAPASN